MTETKKHRTIAERVAAESPYARAAAIWIAEKIGKDPSRIYGVDWYRQDGFVTDAGTHFDGEFGIEYYDNGSIRTYQFWGEDPKPGKFIEECVEIMNRGKG